MMAIRTKLAAAAIVLAGGLGAVFFPLANAQQPGGGGGRPGSSAGGPLLGFAPAKPNDPDGGPGGPGRTSGSATGGPPAAAATGRAQWEYKFLFLPEGFNEKFVKLFTDMGNDGWEFCGSIPPKEPNTNTLIFKRLKVVAPRGPSGGPGPGSSGPKAGPSMGLGGPMGPGGPGAGPASETLEWWSRKVAPMGAGSGAGPPGPGGQPAGNAGHPLTILKLKDASALELTILIERLFPSLTVAVDPRSNALILRADEATLKAVKVLIEQLDVPSKKPLGEPLTR